MKLKTKGKAIGIFSLLGLMPLVAIAAGSDLIAPVAKVELVQDGFKFLEGPVSDGKGSLFFTDMDVNRIYKIDPEGKVSVIVEPSNNAYGMALDRDGSMLICEPSAQRISRMDVSGKITKKLAISKN